MIEIRCGGREWTPAGQLVPGTECQRVYRQTGNTLRWVVAGARFLGWRILVDQVSGAVLDAMCPRCAAPR